MVWIPLSNFLFYGFYQSLTYKRVKKEGVHAILFSLVNHYGLVWFADISHLCRRLAALGHLKASFHCARLHNLCPLKVNGLLHSAI